MCVCVCVCIGVNPVPPLRSHLSVHRYVLHESARYCPLEDHNEAVANVPHWNWQDPFTAYNCTWGFAAPAELPEPADGVNNHYYV